MTGFTIHRQFFSGGVKINAKKKIKRGTIYEGGLYTNIYSISFCKKTLLQKHNRKYLTVTSQRKRKLESTVIWLYWYWEYFDRLMKQRRNLRGNGNIKRYILKIKTRYFLDILETTGTEVAAGHLSDKLSWMDGVTGVAAAKKIKHY